jgi:hypothetical protein
MQCSNCHFENMPGTPMCGRCGTSLNLGAAALDVHPPRAASWRKWLRRQLPVRRATSGIRNAVAATGTGVRDVVLAAGGRQVADAVSAQRQALGVFWRLVVPGWSHYHIGLPLRGRWFLWGFLGLLIPGLLFLGTGWGSILIGLAFSVHSAAVLDIFNQSAPAESAGQQILKSIGVSILLFVLLYMPIGRLIALLAEPQVIQISTPPLQEGDVLLISHLAYRRSGPTPGDVVLYQSVSYRYQTANPSGHGIINYIYEGPRIDRIIAGPGEQVQWNAGWLTINGRLSPLRPLNPRMLPERLEIKVPADCYLIFATTTPNFGPAADAGAWQALSCVRRENIRGRVYLRTHPLFRFGSL